MSFYFINLDLPEERAVYINMIAASGMKMPHFSLEYLDSFCAGSNDAKVFIFENQTTSSFILMPGYFRDIVINDEFMNARDFTSPYGYYGPLFSENVSEEDIANFWKNLDNWYSENNFVTEFIRFGLDNNYRSYSGNLVATLTNIKGCIIDEERQWNNFEHKVRKNVKKAQREGLTSNIYHKNITEEIIDVFYDIYMHTMQRNNATDSFYYSKKDFAHFILNNQELCAIAIIFDGNTPVASELLLVSDDSVYSFLGGTLSDYFDKRPNDLLKFEVINWARKEGLIYYVLGGGYGKDDGIYKYKKSFFPDDSVSYYTGRKILDGARYTELLEICNRVRESRQLEKLATDDETFFPLYRKSN